MIMDLDPLIVKPVTRMLCTRNRRTTKIYIRKSAKIDEKHHSLSMKAPKRSTKEHKCLCAISTWESAITFGSDIKSDRYIKGMMDGFPYRSDHENV